MQAIQRKFNGVEWWIRGDIWDYWREYLLKSVLVYQKDDGVVIEVLPNFGVYFFKGENVQGIINMANNIPDDILSMILNTEEGMKNFSRIPRECKPEKKRSFLQKLFGNQ